MKYKQCIFVQTFILSSNSGIIRKGSKRYTKKLLIQDSIINQLCTQSIVIRTREYHSYTSIYDVLTSPFSTGIKNDIQLWYKSTIKQTNRISHDLFGTLEVTNTVPGYVSTQLKTCTTCAEDSVLHTGLQ